jgi:hypothetical protein
MQSNVVTFPSTEAEAKSTPTNQLPTTDYYDRAEQQFIQLLETEDLDKGSLAAVGDSTTRCGGVSKNR